MYTSILMKKRVLFSVVIRNVDSNKCMKAINHLWLKFLQMGSTGILFSTAVMKNAVFALSTCILALGGAIVGTITGAVTGQTTETGFARGAGIGAVVGAITAIQLMDSMLNGEPFSKVALLYSIVNGNFFAEWAAPALQWQVNYLDRSSTETSSSDIFEVGVCSRGLTQDYIQKLPKHKVVTVSTNIAAATSLTCTICLQDMKNGDWSRTLPDCRHSFHLHCIDEWLTRQASCPICRKDVWFVD